MNESVAGRRVRLNLLIGVLILLLATALGVWLHLGLRPPSLPATAATHFVAADGSRGFADFTLSGKVDPAMVENAQLVGAGILSGVPRGMFDRTSAVPGVDRAQARWAREDLVLLTDNGINSRFRLRSVTDQGVRLHGQSWGRMGMSFEPALLELPADVSAGARWQTDGRAVGDPIDEILTYRTDGQADRPGNAEDAAAGCLQVSTSTRLQPEDAPAKTDASTRWTEVQLWCPGRGVVADRGDFRGTAFELEHTQPAARNTLTRAALDPAVPLGGDLAGWQHGTLAADGGDSTFGSYPTTIDSNGELAAATSGHTLQVANIDGGDVSSLYPLGRGEFQAVGWIHPGAPVTSITGVGALLVITTADRGLSAYDYAGRLRWSTMLPDVATAKPVRISADRLLVATLGGQVLAYTALTGHQLWRHDIGTAVTIEPVAGQGVGAVLASDDQVTALDLDDGHQLWSSTETGSRHVAVVGGHVLSAGVGELTARDLRTGALDWERTDFGSVLGLRAFGDTAVLLLRNESRGYAADGTVRWRRAGAALDARRYGNTDFLLTSNAIVAVDSEGRDRHHWGFDVDLGTEPQLVTGAGDLWAIGQDAKGLSGAWVGPSESG